MDLSILELDETPLFGCKSTEHDPFEDSTDLLFLPGDPFDIPPDDPKPHLVMDPFDSAIPLASTVPNVPHSPAPAASAQAPLQPVAAAALPPHQQTAPAPAAQSLTEPSSPLQENRPVNGVSEGGVRAKKKKMVRQVKKEPTADTKNLDKLAQRKLRNKESARRYREKQVARRRQLENYTRTLTEQNRELEILHERLLRLTCERRGVENDIIPSNGL